MNKTNEVAVANIDLGNPQPDTLNNNQPGILYAANSSRFVEAFFQEALTTYALGWTDKDNLEGLLAFIAPDVPVGRRFEFAKATNAEAFLSETDDIRAIGSDFKRVEYTSAKAVDKTHNKGLTYRVDLDSFDEAAEPNWRQKIVGKLTKRILRNEVRRAFTLLDTAGASNSTAKVWASGATDKDPDVDVMGQIDLFGDTTGLNANRVLYGYTAWKNRLTGLGVQTTAAGFAGRNAQTTDQLKNILMVDGVFISRERYQSAAATKAKIVTAGSVYVFSAEDGLMVDDPSSFKRFVTPVGGQKVRVYEQQISAKLIDLTVEHYSNIVATYDTGVRRLTTT